MKTRPNSFRRLLAIGLCLLVANLIVGCKSYQLGNPTELAFETIFVKPVSNDSFAPQAQALLSSQIRDAFIRDGRLKLVTSEEAADAVLLVNITDYERRAAATQRSDTATARGFDLALIAEISLYNQNRGDYFFKERQLIETSNAYVDNPYEDPLVTPVTQGFLQSEFQAMPRLTRDLARKIADEVLSPWETK